MDDLRMASGTDLAIAIGTIATAVVAAGGLAISLWINKNDNKLAGDRAASDRALAREDVERRHLVDLLLELGREVSRQHAYSASDEGRAAVENITLILWALPAECAYTVRQKFGVNPAMKLPGAVGLKMGHLGLQSAGGNASPGDMLHEIAFDIDRYLNSDLPPALVWDDWDRLKDWMRERWPH